MPKTKKISCVIDRLEEDKAVLKFDDGQQLILAIDFLPQDVGEGDILEINFGGGLDTLEKEERTQKAKDLLNQILKKT